MKPFDFLTIASISNEIQVADPDFNAESILNMLANASSVRADLALFPELCLCGYTCNDLFHQSTLLNGCQNALVRILKESESIYRGLFILGMPVDINGGLFNVAVVCQQGKILGIVPKTYLPNYREFYEQRWFVSAEENQPKSIRFLDQEIPFGTDLLFENHSHGTEPVVVGIELCEDLWSVTPPSFRYALGGSNVLCNLSASNETIGKFEYRASLVQSQSARCFAAYAYAGAHSTESTTDLVFSGDLLIAENGLLLNRSERFEQSSAMIVSDIDLALLSNSRRTANTFHENARRCQPLDFRRIPFSIDRIEQNSKSFEEIESIKKEHFSILLDRDVSSTPFVPSSESDRNERCREILELQIVALAQRLKRVNPPRVSIGISGGLDSTLALLVTCKAFDRLGWKHDRLATLTMPGFGTSERTFTNADRLTKLLNVSCECIDIKRTALEEYKALNHSPFGIDLTNLSLEQLIDSLERVPSDHKYDLVFENVQARIRTNLLMNKGFVIGTGDLSELALGWCTYNADQMSMYNPNVGIPKTLVKYLIEWAADQYFDSEIGSVLYDIAATEISPELLPPDKDGNIQNTEVTIGPYLFHDFLLYYTLRHGFDPIRIYYLMSQTDLVDRYSNRKILNWFEVFYSRFFHNQFKRSCMPDGPKVGSSCLSPRGDWRMPSDASKDLWMKRIQILKNVLINN